MPAEAISTGRLGGPGGKAKDESAVIASGLGGIGARASAVPGTALCSDPGTPGAAVEGGSAEAVCVARSA